MRCNRTLNNETSQYLHQGVLIIILIFFIWIDWVMFKHLLMLFVYIWQATTR